MKAKEEVNYMISDEGVNRCADCVNFQIPDACSQVEGEISEDAICDLYEASEATIEKALFGADMPMKEAMPNG